MDGSGWFQNSDQKCPRQRPGVHLGREPGRELHTLGLGPHRLEGWRRHVHRPDAPARARPCARFASTSLVGWRRWRLVRPAPAAPPTTTGRQPEPRRPRCRGRRGLATAANTRRCERVSRSPDTGRGSGPWSGLHRPATAARTNSATVLARRVRSLPDARQLLLADSQRQLRRPPARFHRSSLEHAFV